MGQEGGRRGLGSVKRLCGVESPKLVGRGRTKRRDELGSSIMFRFSSNLPPPESAPSPPGSQLPRGWSRTPLEPADPIIPAPLIGSWDGRQADKFVRFRPVSAPNASIVNHQSAGFY